MHNKPLLFFAIVLGLMPDIGFADTADSRTATADRRGDAVDLTLKMPDNLPSSWEAGFIEEPVFDSKMLKIEAGVDNERTIILVHGLGQDGHRVWNGLIRVLEERYHILTFDLPGFGRSEKPGGRYSPENYGRLIRWLDTRYSKNKATVIGHSMGGSITLHYAARHPDRVAQVILVDAAGVLEKTAFVKNSARLPVNDDRLPGFVNQWINQVNNLVAQAIEWANVSPDPLEILRGTKSGWNALLSDQPNTNAALALITHDFSEDIDGFPHNTVLIWGGRDSIAPLRIGHVLNGRLPRSRLQVIPEAAHVPMRSHAVRFNRLIERALDSDFQASDPMPAFTPGESVLQCDNQSGNRYSGHYDRIVMNRCIGVHLNDVTARSMELKDTIVEMTNVRIHSDGTAITAENSGLTITNGEITGTVAVHADASRLDLAGVTLSGMKSALAVNQESFLIASVSDVMVNRKRCYLHGTYRLRGETLEASLPEECRTDGLITFLSRPYR